MPLAITLAGCEPGTFYTEVKGVTTVEGDPSPVSTLLGTFPAIGSFSNLDFNANQDFQNQGVSTDQVSSVKVSSLTLKILSPNTQDFSFLDEISFFAKVGDQEALIAQKLRIQSPPLPNPVLELELTEVELQPFIAAPSMSIVVRGKGRVPPQDTTLEAEAQFRVGVRLVDL